MRRACVLAVWGALTAGLALLAACSPAPDESSAVTPDEQRQLNEAAAQLDANAGVPASNESAQP